MSMLGTVSTGSLVSQLQPASFSRRHIPPGLYRRVLGYYPTGVTAVTSLGADGKMNVMIIGSFTTISLEPPLVGFFPTETSYTWSRIEQAGKFCVSVLSENQETVSRTLSRKGGSEADRFEWERSSLGLPVLTGAVAWIDCEIESVQPVGDHYFVLARVVDLEAKQLTSPLVFHQGCYGKLEPMELSSVPQQDDYAPVSSWWE